MSANKAVELQMQMRQNAEDLHNFMKELDSWEEDMKKKDEELRTENLAESQVRNIHFTSLSLCYSYKWKEMKPQ